MAVTLFAKKIGMTRVFSQDGKTSTPFTVLEMIPSVVTQVRTAETDGYTAVQVGWGEVKPRNSTIPMIGQGGLGLGDHPRRLVGKRDIPARAQPVGIGLPQPPGPAPDLEHAGIITQLDLIEHPQHPVIGV